MQQHDLFGSNPGNADLASIIDYKPAVFTAQEAAQYMQQIIAQTPWQQRAVLMYGKEVMTPRLTCWYGDQDVDYSANGRGEVPLPWTDTLLQIRDRVISISGIIFNSVLLNYYRNGNDSVSWHTDNDGIPGRNAVVASVSFGQTRTFDIRSKHDHSRKYSIDLENGSYLLMKEGMQEQWQHRIAKSARQTKERLNLTFRVSDKIVESRK